MPVLGEICNLCHSFQVKDFFPFWIISFVTSDVKISRDFSFPLCIHNFMCLGTFFCDAKSEESAGSTANRHYMEINKHWL